MIYRRAVTFSVEVEAEIDVEQTEERVRFTIQRARVRGANLTAEETRQVVHVLGPRIVGATAGGVW